MKRKISLILLFVLCFSFVSNTYASSLSDLEKEKRQQQKIQQELDRQLKSNLEAQKDVAVRMTIIDEQILTNTEDLIRIEAELASTSANLARVEKHLFETQEKRDEKYAVFMERVNYIYENGNYSYVKIVMNANNFTDLSYKLQYVEDLIDYDNRIVNELEALEKEITAQKVLVTNSKRAIEKLLDEEIKRKHNLGTAMVEKEKEQKRLIETGEDLDKLLLESEALESSLLEKIKAKKMSEAAKMSYVNGMPAYTGGKYLWPSQYSTVTSEYGLRVHPISGTHKMHTGIDLHAVTGSNIFAAENGTVIIASTMGGYGRTVLIDHGGGLSTLYAHNSKLNVSPGQKVTRGAVIAQAGSTGVSTGPHCHFEVRVNGVHTDPRPYITP